MLRIMQKEIIIESSPVVYSEVFTERNINEHWHAYGGDWLVEDGWLTGRNNENCPGMIVCNESFPGNVLLDFKARTVIPCTHDIDVMWNGSWDEAGNNRDVAYVAGLAGWWEGKAGIEKSPEYKLNAATSLFDLVPGQTYHVQCGSIDGHCFIFVDGRLILEVTDPDPIDSRRYAKVGFEAYCSHIQVRDLIIRQIHWQPRVLSYTPEF